MLPRRQPAHPRQPDGDRNRAPVVRRPTTGRCWATIRPNPSPARLTGLAPDSPRTRVTRSTRITRVARGTGWTRDPSDT